MSPEMLIAMISAKALSFGDMARGGRPEWTARDAAQACAGLPPRIYAALCFTYAGDESKYWTLLSELQRWADRVTRGEMCMRRMVDNPPPRVWTEEACADVGALVEMWLLEVKQPWRFARQDGAPTPDLRRVIMACDQKTWQRRYSQAYEAIGLEFTTWLDVGAKRMRKRLRDPSAEEFAAQYSQKVEAQGYAKLAAAASRSKQWAVKRVKDERGHAVYQSRCARD